MLSSGLTDGWMSGWMNVCHRVFQSFPLKTGMKLWMISSKPNCAYCQPFHTGTVHLELLSLILQWKLAWRDICFFLKTTLITRVSSVHVVMFNQDKIKGLEFLQQSFRVLCVWIDHSAGFNEDKEDSVHWEACEIFGQC